MISFWQARPPSGSHITGAPLLPPPCHHHCHRRAPYSKIQAVILAVLPLVAFRHTFVQQCDRNFTFFWYSNQHQFSVVIDIAKLCYHWNISRTLKFLSPWHEPLRHTTNRKPNGLNLSDKLYFEHKHNSMRFFKAGFQSLATHNQGLNWHYNQDHYLIRHYIRYNHYTWHSNRNNYKYSPW